MNRQKHEGDFFKLYYCCQRSELESSVQLSRNQTVKKVWINSTPALCAPKNYNFNHYGCQTLHADQGRDWSGTVQRQSFSDNYCLFIVLSVVMKNPSAVQKNAPAECRGLRFRSDNSFITFRRRLYRTPARWASGYPGSRLRFHTTPGQLPDQHPLCQNQALQ